MQFNMTVQCMEVIMGCLCIMVSGLDHRYSSPTHTQHTPAHAEKLPTAYIIRCLNKVRSLPTLPRLGTLSGFSLSQTEHFKHVKSFPSSLPKPSLSKTTPILTLWVRKQLQLLLNKCLRKWRLAALPSARPSSSRHCAEHPRSCVCV